MNYNNYLLLVEIFFSLIFLFFAFKKPFDNSKKGENKIIHYEPDYIPYKKAA